MDWTLIILLFAGTIIIVIFMIAAMRQAYQLGLAQGRLEASIKNTELTFEQWAANQAQGQEAKIREIINQPGGYGNKKTG